MLFLWRFFKAVLLCVFLVVTAFAGVMFVGALGTQVGPALKKAGKEVQKDLASGVADDMIDQYDIVVRNNGSEIDKHVRASMVAESYLQAGDEESYAKWKRLRDIHARNAGVPTQR